MKESTLSGRSRRALYATVGGLLFTLLVPVAAVAQGACQGYEKRKRLAKLGGPNSFSKSGVETVGDLQAEFVKHAEEIEYLLETQGMFDLIPAVFAAVESGDVEERNLLYGETFEWMAFRYKGKPMVTDGLCVDTKTEYEAFVIKVTTGAAGAVAAKCRVSAEASCEYGNEMISVDASGSSDGVEVTMAGGGSSRSTISDTASGSSWSGQLDDPWRTTYTVTASAEGGGAGTATTYTFVIPKTCLNFAFAGKTATTVMADVGGCSESVEVSCTPTAPSCEISAAADVQTRKPLDVSVTGSWAGGMIAVEGRDRSGNPVPGVELAGSSGTLSFPRGGTYTLVGTATNEVGETATCQTDVAVSSRWAVRVNAGPVLASADSTFGGAMPLSSSDVYATKLIWDKGFGGEVGATYFFNQRIGLNGTLAYAQYDSMFLADSPTAWEMDSDTIGTFSLYLGPEITLNPGRRAEVYVTPFIGWTSIDSGGYRAFGESISIDFEDELNWGVALGLDIPFTATSAWNLNLQARYTDLGTEYEKNNVEVFRLNVTPIALGIGVTFDF